MPRLVLEIGTEELPPRFFPPAMAQLREQSEAMLRRARLSFDAVTVLGTPRRLVVIVEGVAAQQAGEVREERGPSAKVAFDAAGQPTKAAEGFARRHGLTAADLVVKEGEQGEYVYAVVHTPEAPAGQALATLLPELISGLSFPKTMRWGSTPMRFGRPIRWLLALLDDEVIPFSLAGLDSGREARGHPMLADGRHPISHAAQYEAELEQHFVIVDPARRRETIELQIAGIAGAEGAQVVDGGLLEETVYLVEWPTCGKGSFDPAFLRLPRPVLVEEMRHVQSYFPLETAEGELRPGFIAVRDGGRDYLETVVRGWEHVLVAKLIDVSFFYEQDLKKPLAARVEALRGVVFKEKLGTMYEKMERVRWVAEGLADELGLDDARREQLLRAAELCKADLTTMVVTGDLSSLQGTMGGIYAARDEAPEVAEAISEHYLPRGAGDPLPAPELGRMLALADRIDTLSACFAAGVVPTGSADPFGLRREAVGIISLLLGLRAGLGLSGLVGPALSKLGQQVGFPSGHELVATQEKVLDFIRQRLEVILREEWGVRYDLVTAALAVDFFSVGDAVERAKALQEVAGREDFLGTVMAATRVTNIVKGVASGHPVNTSLLSEPEQALEAVYQAVRKAADAKTQQRDYVGLFDVLAGLREPVNAFFEAVLVMDPDEKVRQNRLALLTRVNDLFRRLADLSCVVQM